LAVAFAATRTSVARRSSSSPSSSSSLLRVSSSIGSCLFVAAGFAIASLNQPAFGFAFARSMSGSITSRDASGNIFVTPRNEAKQSALVIITHGLGDTSEGWLDAAEEFSQRMPHIKFILPNAPVQRVTMNMGMSMPSWYDIVGLDARSAENCKGIEESQAKLEKFLRDEHENIGLPYERMILAGFSQGGALSLYTGLQLPHKIGGILVMSGYLPAKSKVKVTPGLEQTPILHCHGTADPLVRLESAYQSKEAVIAMGVSNYEIKTYPMEHSACQEELVDVREFILKILPDDGACYVKLKDPKEMSVKELKEAIKRAGIGRKAIGFMEKSEYVNLLIQFREGTL